MDFYANRYLDSDCSITESRVLYEIHEMKECTADDIVKKLHLDKGYVSRIIKRFENTQILQREKSQTDARAYLIRLTAEGIRFTESLISRSDQEIGSLISPLSEEECVRLEDSMDTIRKILDRRSRS